jgi:hypothetical protein
METTTETIYDSRQEPKYIIAPEDKKASGLDRGDVIIPADAKRHLDKEDGVLGSSECPPTYCIDDVRDNGRRIVVQVHAMPPHKERRTFYMDHDKEVSVILAKTMRGMRTPSGAGQS